MSGIAYTRRGTGPLLICHCGGPGFSGSTLVPVFMREPPNVDALSYFNTQVAPRYDIRGELPRIEAPTLAISGELDFFGPPANREIVEGIPEARCVVLPDAGHFVWFDEPDRFREEVTRFLSE
jgi:pimeloyl-ACP methyl ester carboxylesterase